MTKLIKLKFYKKKILKVAVKYLSFGLKKKKFYTRAYSKVKRKYRFIDFYRLNYLIPAFVLKIEYDPNRSASIALICYKNGLLSYIIAPVGLKIFTYISTKIFIPGYVNTLDEFRFGAFIHCVENIKQYGAKVARSAGSFCILLNRYDSLNLVLRLPSGEHKIFFNKNKAALGMVSNLNFKYKKLKKAGTKRLLRFRPKVRGVAQNCVDHPHGGGRGKTSKLSICSNFTRRVLRGVKLKKKIRNFKIIKIRN